MKALLVGTAGILIALAGSAVAADMAYKASPPAVAPIYSWTGFYIGANAGYAWTDSTDSLTPANAVAQGFFTPPPPQIATSLPLNPKGFIGGGQFGYNWQVSPMWVLGFETDFQGANLNSTISLPGPADTTRIMTATEKLDWIGTFRGRVGATPWNRTLVYFTGGLAYGQGSLSTALTRPGIGSPTGCGGLNNCQAGAVSGTNTGWTVGGGVEWAFASNWSLKGEYLYYDLGTLSHSMTDPFFPAVFNASANLRGSIARAGLNFKF